MAEPVVLENDSWRVGLLPATGGSVGFARVAQDDGWVDVLRPTQADRAHLPGETASFPLVPWSNRIRDALLRWGGEKYQLRHWEREDVAMHGAGWEFPWEVVDADATRAELIFDSRAFSGVNWPWEFVARFTYRLDGPSYVWQMSLENVDDETFPAGLGHHPYFVRATDHDDAILQINCDKGYALTAAMPDRAAGEIPAHADFREPRPLGSTFVDECLTGRTSSTVATIAYPGGPTIDLNADDLLSHVVVYLPEGQSFFAVEPVSHANDGFTLAHNGVNGHGIRAVAPGEEFAAKFTLRLRG